MDGYRQSGLLNGLVWVIIVVAISLVGVFVYNTYVAQAPGINGTKNTGAPPQSMATSTLVLESAAFQHGASIPSQFTCDGTNSSPPLSWLGVPSSAKSLALIMDDPDVPKQLRPGGVFDHWVLFNIPADVSNIPASSAVGVAGVNGAGKNAYAGPCPPPQYEPSEHRYFFRLYALDTLLAIQAGATKAQILEAMRGHIIREAELMGRYKRVQE